MARRLANIKSRNQSAFDYVINSLEIITPFGKEALKKQPTFYVGDEEALSQQLSMVASIKELIETQKNIVEEMKLLLMPIKDIRFSIERSQNAILSTVELFEIKSLLLIFEKLKAVTGDLDIPQIFKLEDTQEILNNLDPRNDRLNTFYIYEEFSKKLGQLRQEKREQEINIRVSKKAIKEEVKKEYGIHLTPKFDYSISKTDEKELEKLSAICQLEQVGQDYMSITFAVKQTEEEKKNQENIDRMSMAMEEEEEVVRERLSKKIWQFQEKIIGNAQTIGYLDLNIAKASHAIKHNCIKPEIVKEHKIEIKEGRHIQLEDILKRKKKEYVPISLELSQGVTCITGANMGGKTISLKLVGLMILLTQNGFFIPAKEAKIGLSNFVQMLIGDSQSVERGLSSFGSEMEELKEILDNSKERSLILIDEIASGTNPIEGRALTKSIIDFLKGKEYITVITTHFEAAQDKLVKNLQVIGLGNIDFDLLDREIRYANRKERIEIIGKYMDYRLVERESERQVPKDALNIAKMLGISNEIIESAKKYL